MDRCVCHSSAPPHHAYLDPHWLKNAVLGSFIFARVTGQFIVRLKLFSSGRLSIVLEFKSTVLCKSIASKKYSIWYELYFKNYLIAEGSSGSIGRAREMRERTYSRECPPRKKISKTQSSDSSKAYRKPSVNCLLRTTLFESGHMRNEHKARHETKIYEHWQGQIEKSPSYQS